MRHVYYYAPLVLHFRSGSTLQETRNFTHLARRGYKTFFCGTYTDADAYAEVLEYIGDAPISHTAKEGGKNWRFLVELLFLKQLYQDRSPDKIVIARVFDRMTWLLKLRHRLGNPLLVYELHERALPHMLAAERGQPARVVNRIKERCQRVFDGIDGLVLTNYSQEIILKQEFARLPPYTIIPHGVEWDKFHRASTHHDGNGGDSAEPFIVTLTGSFHPWKNVEVLFKLLTHLDERFKLRIAGEISSKHSDAENREYIQQLVERYNVQGRVHFCGFVSPNRIVEDALAGSSVLFLPLGDNAMARYFTCPIKLPEYMATQIPVVAVDYPSVRLITGDDTVFLAPNDPRALAKAIEAAVFSPERDERVRRMNTLAKQLTFEERSKRLDAWLTELLASRR
jgi:glycosyltransferase involved in cell wall biosynthesis